MLIDITMQVTPQILEDARRNTNPALVGHIGTHFDVMDKEFPLAYTRREGIVFDVRHIPDREIGTEDVDLAAVKKDMFVLFCTGYIEKEPYGSRTYFSQHPYLTMELITALLDKGVSVIGLDFAGIRRTPEHIPTDQICADRGVFIIENLCGLHRLLETDGFTLHTYPMNCTGITGLPCRVIAEIH